MKIFSNILVSIGVTIILLSFGMKSKAVGQMPLCDGDPCVNAANCGSWVQATPLILPLDPNCPACSLEVHYKFRDNSNCSNPCPNSPPFEFQIDFIIADGTCFYPCNGNPPKFNFGDLDKLYMEAVFQLLKKYSLPFIHTPPNPPLGCGPVFPNFKGASCKKEYVAPTGKVYLMTCFLTECCVQNIQYCVDAFGNESMSKTNIYSPYDDCGTDPDGLSCSYSCDWEWEESILPKSVNTYPNNIYDNFQLNYTINPDVINIALLGELNGSLNLNIFNTEGISLISKNFDINNSKFEIEINNNFSSGSYYIAFELNGNLIKIENFMIIK